MELSILLTGFKWLIFLPVVYILYLQLIFLFCIELVIAWDKDIKMIKFTELITLHKFRFAIILIKSWQSVVGSTVKFIHTRFGPWIRLLGDGWAIAWCHHRDILSFYISLCVFHCVWRLFLIGMLIVFILMSRRKVELGAGIK